MLSIPISHTISFKEEKNMLEQQKDITETITVHTKATKKAHTQNNTHPLTLAINKIIISMFEGNNCRIFFKCYKNTLICVLI